MRTWFCIGILCLLCACATSGQVGGSKFIFLSSTIGPIDAGIVDVLETAFEKETGIRVRHVGSGTGAALNLARNGQIDLVMVHAKSLEEKFVAEGFGTERIDLMYNDFVIVGPANDPAGVKGMKLAGDALKKIAEKGVLFISRGDNSGTHVAEMDLWKNAGIKPSGSWYQVFEKGSTGNVPTLQYTDQKSAYTVIDRATFLTLKDKIKLVVLVEKDEAMLNFISLIPVSPQKFPKVNYQDTMIFVKWLTSPEKGQKIIRDFGKDKYGSPLFFPNSKEWRQAQGGKS
jgi:tungstate transport system substrate-binding protein